MGDSRAMSELPFLVAGGGIGGLAAALALARSGHAVAVFEQAERFGEIGAGIQLGPNAFHALDRLGVGQVARDAAVFIDGLVLMDALSDERVCLIPLEEDFRRTFGNPYAVAHRADLHGALLETCRAHAGVELVTRHRVVNYRQDAERVVAQFDTGGERAGIGLIGADGLRSAIRQRIVGDGEPRVSGHTTFRSVIPTSGMPADLRWNAATLWAGPGCHIVHYPLRGWELFNLVATWHSGETEAVAGQPVETETVRSAFVHLAERPRRILEAASDWRKWVLCDREPVEVWVDGRVALLGDAAHPMLQYMAQGACMALEDGVSLAENLRRAGGEVANGFRLYNAERVARTARVQLSSRLMGEYVYHPDGARRLARNAALQAKSAEDFYRSLEWLYGHRLPQAPDAAAAR